LVIYLILYYKGIKMSTSRILRIVIGLALIGYAVYSQNNWFYLGAIPLFMGIFDICPKKILSKYFAKEECCEGQSCCSSNQEDKSACCSPKDTPKPLWSASKEEKCCDDESDCSGDDAILIEILGTGCTKCVALEKVVKEAIKEIDGSFTVKKVSELEKIMAYGVVSTPSLVVAGKVLSTGKLLSLEEVKNLLEA